MKDRINEGNITGSISSLTIKDTEIILNQMKTSICIIYHILGEKKQVLDFFVI